MAKPQFISVGRRVQQRAVVVEVVGPWGSGKSAAISALCERDDAVHLAQHIWALPKRLLFMSGLPLLTTILGLFRASRRLLWSEAKHLIKLRAMYQQLRSQRDRGHRLVIIDEGLVIGMSWLRGYAHPSATNGGLASWWPKALRQCAQTVDLVIFLDAPDGVLAQRIRTRQQRHPLKHKSDAELIGFIQQDRAACLSVVSDLSKHHGVPVLSFRTDEQSTAEITDRILEAAERTRMSVEPGGEAPAASTSLTKRAVLTAVASLLDYGAQLIVGLVVTPILVAGLGAYMFGIWEMLKQLVGYMTATDGRPMDALRLVIANQQESQDAGTMRRWVGSAFAVWLLFLPVIVLGGGVVIGLAPTITHVAPELHLTIRVACALLVITFLASTLAAIPEAVLRGMNLGYKRMGLQAGLSVAGGALSVVAVAGGWGVGGLGVAQLALAGLTGLCFWMLVRHYVPAFGVARPSRPEIRSLLVMSAWLTGGIIIGHALTSTDLLILGAVLSPAVVATYVLTGNAARMAVSLVNFTVGAAIPGLGGVIGQRRYDRAAQARGEILTLTWLFVTAVGATILVWNRSFVSLWVGQEHYAGVWPDLLIVCLMVQTAFIRSDGFVIDAALRPRGRVIVAAAAAVLMIVVALALTPALGIVGLCLGLLIGRFPQTIAHPLLAASLLHQSRVWPVGRLARRIMVMAGMFAGAAYLGDHVIVRHWLPWLGAAAGTLIVALGTALWAGLSAEDRRSVLQRGTTMWRAFHA